MQDSSAIHFYPIEIHIWHVDDKRIQLALAFYQKSTTAVSPYTVTI